MAPPQAQPQQPSEGFMAEVQREASERHTLAPNVLNAASESENVGAVRTAVENLSAIVRERPDTERSQLAEAVGIALAAHVESLGNGIAETKAAFEARVSKTISRIAEITKVAKALTGAQSNSEITDRLGDMVTRLQKNPSNLNDLSEYVAAIEAARLSAASKAESGGLVATWTAGFRRYLSGGTSTNK